MKSYVQLQRGARKIYFILSAFNWYHIVIQLMIMNIAGSWLYDPEYCTSEAGITPSDLQCSLPPPCPVLFSMRARSSCMSHTHYILVCIWSSLRTAAVALATTSELTPAATSDLQGNTPMWCTTQGVKWATSVAGVALNCIKQIQLFQVVIRLMLVQVQ